MPLDDILPVKNFSDLTIQSLVDRLQRSTTLEHCIYREVELDELWRLIDSAARSGGLDDVRDAAHLTAIAAAVHRAHDLVGRDNRPLEAAETLRMAFARPEAKAEGKKVETADGNHG